MTTSSEARPLVLYVDDESANRIVFEQSLAEDFRIRTAPDAASALALLEEVEVAVVVTDMRMPGMTGDQLLAIVKERWPAAVRIVITAYCDIEPILRAINEGLVARYVIKPWQYDELVQLLRWAIEGWTFGKESAALQRRLLETERLATLGSVAGAVVHDLNQPLAGLVINADRLVEVAEAAGLLPSLVAAERLSLQDRARVEELAEELPELARDLHASALHLREVTAGLSQFLYARLPDAPAAPIDPLPLVKNAIAVCRDLAIRARGLIVYEGPAILPHVRVGATELTQVLINLISNAAHALVGRERPDGRVRVTARSDSALLTFTIQDDGAGMPPDVLARVGTPFFTTRKEGIGLGLAQVQRLVGKSGGSFKIDSQPGVGTTVTFALPVG